MQKSFLTIAQHDITLAASKGFSDEQNYEIFTQSGQSVRGSPHSFSLKCFRTVISGNNTKNVFQSSNDNLMRPITNYLLRL